MDAGRFAAVESAGFAGGVAGAFADCPKLRKEAALRQMMSEITFFIDPFKIQKGKPNVRLLV